MQTKRSPQQSSSLFLSLTFGVQQALNPTKKTAYTKNHSPVLKVKARVVFTLVLTLTTVKTPLTTLCVGSLR